MRDITILILVLSLIILSGCSKVSENFEKGREFTRVNPNSLKEESQKINATTNITEYEEVVQAKEDSIEKDIQLTCNIDKKEINDIILKAKQLPKNLGEKNSWGDYKYPKIVFPEVVGDKVSVNYPDSYNLLDFKYDVSKYISIEEAEIEYNRLSEELKTNSNINQDSGNYGDKDIEYYSERSKYHDGFVYYFGKKRDSDDKVIYENPYSIMFRKGTFIINIGVFYDNLKENKEIAISIAKEFEENLCK